MNHLRKKPRLKNTVAGGLFVGGFVAGVIPGIPGWVLIGLGLYLLILDNPSLEQKMVRYRARHKTVDYLMRQTYDRIHARLTPSSVEHGKL